MSIVAACLSRRRRIVNTLNSVIWRTTLQIEHIGVDGEATGGTVDALKRYAASYNLRWLSEPDPGLSHEFSRGVAATIGEWLYFLNGDDYLVDYGAVDCVTGWIAAHLGHSIYLGGTDDVDKEGVEISYGSESGIADACTSIRRNLP